MQTVAPKPSFLKLQREKKRRNIRDRCTRDLFYFANTVLRDFDNTSHLPLSDFHAEFCDHLMKQGELTGLRLLNLYPRSHLKTEIGTKAYIAWRLLRNPKLRIGLVASTDDNARAFLSDIVAIFQRNERFRKLFPELIPRKFGTIDTFTIPNSRTDNRPSIRAFGCGSKVASAHFDLMVFDDMIPEHTQETPHSPELMAAKTRWFLAATFLLDNIDTSDRVVTGTRWHDADTYGVLEDSGDWRVFKRVVETNGVPLWPEKFSIEAIEREKRVFEQAGMLDLFYAQYYNDPVPPGEARLGGYRKYSGTPPADATILRMGVDPASSVDARAAQTGMVGIRVTPGHDVYVEYARGTRMDPKDITRQIFAVNEALYQSTAEVGIETVGFQKMLASDVLNSQIELGKFFGIWEIERLNKQTKEQFVFGTIHPFVATGRLYVHESLHEMMKQLDRFPKSKLWDLLDALALALRTLPTIEMRTLKEKELMFGPVTRDAEGQIIDERQKLLAPGEEEFEDEDDRGSINADQTLGSDW